VTEPTVELPADPEIKQLAHIVVRDDNEYAVPLLRDFYRFLALLDENQVKAPRELELEETDSGMRAGSWQEFLDTLEENDVVEIPRGQKEVYTLDEEVIEE